MSDQFRTLLLCLAIVLSGGRVSASDAIIFSRDVLPILSDRCFHCHGPDDKHREAELRLDLRESAIANRSGSAAIVPHDPDMSALLKRVSARDPALQMPPPASRRKQLSQREIDILRQWIANGASWGRHWAFMNPERPVLADPKAHPVDTFVQSRLRDQGIGFAPNASKFSLIRRLYFDLNGLPPTFEEVQEFVADQSSEAYGKLVDRLLRSPRYGERMAMWWLDAARYSDTDGFAGDSVRTNWPWRDWVVQSFNENKPFDQFTIEQFAGDLLHNATPEQILATCFHRNHMTNGEGGRDPEESRIDYVIDRVNTVGTVWLGLTLGCCQCHSHKFDPISQHEYYSLFAFFNSIEEDGRAGGKATPYLKYKSIHANRAIEEAEDVVKGRRIVERTARAQAERDFGPWLNKQIDFVQYGFEPWHPLRADSLAGVEGTILTQEDDGKVQASGPNPRHDDYRLIASSPVSHITGLRLEIFPNPSHPHGKLSRGARGEFVLTDVKLQVRQQGQSQVRDVELISAIADVEKQLGKETNGREYGLIKDTLDDDPRNGWTIAPEDADKPHVAIFAFAQPLQLARDEQLIFTMLQRSTQGDANIGRFRLSVTDQPGAAVRSLGKMPLEELAATKSAEPNEFDAELRARLLDQFLADQPGYQNAKASLDRAERQLASIKAAAGELNVMVLKELSISRKTHILERGVWDKRGLEVRRAVPAAILAWSPNKTKARLDLAHWLVSKDNPLTARVVVNQLWQLCFGAGLVRTPEDFGLQGELPTHPELLDWLACELVDHQWDLKHILRLIVTSQTYRQSSVATHELLERDPENRLLARGARFRLPSWMIRDAALQSSGLLNPAIGGPPVMPYQPEGVWEELSMGRFQYEPSQGAVQFRRTLYAFWRRAVAPTFLFDSAQRRYCEVRQQRTNTPLHALTLLNDLSLMEAARALAGWAIVENIDSAARIKHIFRHILSRSPTAHEQEVLARELSRALQHYRETPDDAIAFLNFGQPENRRLKRPNDLAAYTVLASMVLNLDEAITHE